MMLHWGIYAKDDWFISTYLDAFEKHLKRDHIIYDRSDTEIISDRFIDNKFPVHVFGITDFSRIPECRVDKAIIQYGIHKDTIRKIYKQIGSGVIHGNVFIIDMDSNGNIKKFLGTMYGAVR